MELKPEPVVSSLLFTQGQIGVTGLQNLVASAAPEGAVGRVDSQSAPAALTIRVWSLPHEPSNTLSRNSRLEVRLKQPKNLRLNQHRTSCGWARGALGDHQWISKINELVLTCAGGTKSHVLTDGL